MFIAGCTSLELRPLLGGQVPPFPDCGNPFTSAPRPAPKTNAYLTEHVTLCVLKVTPRHFVSSIITA